MSLELWMELFVALFGFTFFFVAAWWMDHNPGKAEKKITTFLVKFKILSDTEHSINIR